MLGQQRRFGCEKGVRQCFDLDQGVDSWWRAGQNSGGGRATG